MKCFETSPSPSEKCAKPCTWKISWTPDIFTVNSEPFGTNKGFAKQQFVFMRRTSDIASFSYSLWQIKLGKNTNQQSINQQSQLIHYPLPLYYFTKWVRMNQPPRVSDLFGIQNYIDKKRTINVFVKNIQTNSFLK